MSELAITIEIIIDEDYDGVEETVKELCGSIDGVAVEPQMTFEDSVSDADCKTAFKAKLTELEYTWTTEV